MIRQPAVAGSFYPADKNTLINQINEFLSQVKIVPTKEKLRILIVPHAGYSYSGQVAGRGFRQVNKNDYQIIILIGVSHSSYFEGTAVWDKGSWQTPLGLVEIDESFANQLISESQEIHANLDAHFQEHSLEIELPFLQQTLTDFKIVPILLGQTNNDLLENLAEKLAENFDDKTLLIVSSDLSHYPSYEIANKVDRETVKVVLSGNLEEFNRVIKKNLNQSGIETCACGADAIKVAMLLAKKLKINQIKLLKYANSGDVIQDKSRVVGYAAIGFYNGKSNIKNQIAKIQSKNQKELNKEEQKKLLKIARDTLENYLKNKKIPDYKVEDEILNQNFGAFVTLRKEGQLRGCIGEFESAKPLFQIVQKKAVDAALNDPRFHPVDFNELKDIKIEISVLSPRKKIDDWQKIKLGIDGVAVKKDNQGGTFLPQVAIETGWNLEQFLENLCANKAGLPKDCYKDKDVEIFTFTAQAFEE